MFLCLLLEFRHLNLRGGKDLLRTSLHVTLRACLDSLVTSPAPPKPLLRRTTLVLSAKALSASARPVALAKRCGDFGDFGDLSVLRETSHEEHRRAVFAHKSSLCRDGARGRAD